MFNKTWSSKMEANQETQGSALRLDRPVSVIIPRALREQDAAAYSGFSSSHLRNQRAADMRALKAGATIKGPRWVTIGTAVRYLREDLDDWLNAHRVDPGQGDPEVEGGAA
jgi:predicted DNA-binding transcriptional regulator AlpA